MSCDCAFQTQPYLPLAFISISWGNLISGCNRFVWPVLVVSGVSWTDNFKMREQKPVPNQPKRILFTYWQTVRRTPFENYWLTTSENEPTENKPFTQIPVLAWVRYTWHFGKGIFFKKHFSRCILHVIDLTDVASYHRTAELVILSRIDDTVFHVSGALEQETKVKVQKNACFWRPSSLRTNSNISILK